MAKVGNRGFAQVIGSRSSEEGTIKSTLPARRCGSSTAQVPPLRARRCKRRLPVGELSVFRCERRGFRCTDRTVCRHAPASRTPAISASYHDASGDEKSVSHAEHARENFPSTLSARECGWTYLATPIVDQREAAAATKLRKARRRSCRWVGPEPEIHWAKVRLRRRSWSGPLRLAT